MQGEVDLSHKRYRRPEGFAGLQGGEYDHVHNHGDLLAMENLIALVMPENRDAGSYAPSRGWFGVSSPLAFNPGDEILVDLENGFSQTAIIKKRTGRMLELDSLLDVAPQVAGEVYKIIGRKSVQIDMRFDLDTGKGNDKWRAYQQEQERAKQALASELNKVIPKRRKPGWGFM